MAGHSSPNSLSMELEAEANSMAEGLIQVQHGPFIVCLWTHVFAYVTLSAPQCVE